MASQSQIRIIFSFRNSIRTSSSAKPLCTMSGSTQVSESPELPDWVKIFDTKSSSHSDPDDDAFVIPPLAHWLEDHSQVVKKKLGEASDTAMDQISMMLKNRYPSPENVAEALNGRAYSVSNTLVAQLLKRFGNDWIRAYVIFKWAKEQTSYGHSAESYNSMVDILGRAKKFRLMWELVDEMSHLSGYVSLETMSKVIRRLTRAGRYQEAIEAFRGIEKYGVSKDITAMNVLMDALVKEGNVEDAHKVFEELKGSMPFNFTSFNVLIHGYCKARKLDEAWKIMEEVEKHGFEPDVISYTAFIEAHCRDKDFEKVDKILVQMEQKGCRPNAVTFTIIIHALGKAKQINEALRIYQKMKKVGCVPDSSFYSSLIFILGKAGRLKDVEEIVEDMTKQGVNPDVLTYNTMISSACACAHSQEETAVRLLRKMEADSCKPVLKTYHPLLKMFCSSLIFILGKAGRLKDVDEIIEDMTKQGFNPDVLTYNTMISHACAHSQEETALRLLQKMEDSCKPDFKTYQPLLKLFCKKKRMKVFKLLLDHMFKNDVSIEAGTYSILVRGLCEDGTLHLACSFFGEMVSKGMVPKDSIFKMLKEELERKSMLEEMKIVEKLMSYAAEKDKS